MIGSSVLGPGTFAQHLKVRAHKRSVGKRSLFAGLMLTSMVDMFSLLVIFLLQSFSSSPELLTITKGVTLPASGTARELKDAPVLSLAEDFVYLDQKKVGETAALVRNPEPLVVKLNALRMVWEKTHPTEKFKGEINLQAHRELPSTLVSQVMAVLPSARYSSIELAVISGSGK